MSKLSGDSSFETPIVPPELHGRRRPAPLSRADRSPIAKWYAEVDRGLLIMILALMAIGLLVNDVLSWNRNRGLDPARRIPNGRTLSRRALRRI